MGAHIKLISRWEFEWSLIEAFQDGLCDFSHVELRSTEGDVCSLCATAPSAGRGDQETNTLSSFKMLKVPHLISLPQQRQLIAVNGTFHHMDVIVFNTEI